MKEIWGASNRNSGRGQATTLSNATKVIYNLINDPVVSHVRGDRQRRSAFNAVEAIAVACGALLRVSNGSAPLYTY